MSLISIIKTLMTDVEDVYESRYEAQQELIKNFLQDAGNSIIRLYVVDTSGLGHQATTIQIMYRLIVLGFNHNFELVYDNGSGDTKAKLTKLIPGFDAIGLDTQKVTLNASTSVTLIELQTFIKDIAQYPKKKFGFTGGFDTNATNHANNPALSSKGVNVDFFLKLQPFQWNSQNAIQRFGLAQDTFTILEGEDALGTSLKNRGYSINPPAAPADTVFGTDAAKLTAYKQIIAATTGVDATVNLMPVYGIGQNRHFPGNRIEAAFNIGNGIQAAFNIRPENVLFYLISGMRHIQQFSKIGGLKRGTIILNLAYGSDGVYTRLNALLKGIDSGNRNQGIDRLNQFVTSVGAVAGNIINDNVEVVNYTDGNKEWLQTKIDALEGEGGVNKVLVIRIDGLPLPAFEYVYASSSASCLLEGKATANLALNLNKPYLNLLKDGTIVYPTLPIAAVEAGPQATQSDAAARGLNDSAETTNGYLPADGLVLDPPSEGLMNTGMYKIAHFITQGYTDESDLQKYFLALQTFWQNPQEDKLFQSLLFFLSYVNGLDED